MDLKQSHTRDCNMPLNSLPNIVPQHMIDCRVVNTVCSSDEMQWEWWLKKWIPFLLDFKWGNEGWVVIIFLTNFAVKDAAHFVVSPLSSRLVFCVFLWKRRRIYDALAGTFGRLSHSKSTNLPASAPYTSTLAARMPLVFFGRLKNYDQTFENKDMVDDTTWRVSDTEVRS